MNILKKICCFIFGHQKPVNLITENESYIHFRACPRCKTPTMFPVFWKGMLPPPNECIEEWKKFLDNEISTRKLTYEPHRT